MKRGDTVSIKRSLRLSRNCEFCYEFIIIPSETKAFVASEAKYRLFFGLKGKHKVLDMMIFDEIYFSSSRRVLTEKTINNLNLAKEGLTYYGEDEYGFGDEYNVEYRENN